MSNTSTDAELLSFERRAQPLTGPLLPLLPPKRDHRELPTLPQRTMQQPVLGVNHPDWTYDTFIVPAAFPRSVRNSTQAPQQQQRQAAVGARVKIDPKQAYRDMIDAQVEARARKVTLDDSAELNSQQQLHLAVTRYRPKMPRLGTGPGLTLVFAHANGFHKEIWEPTLSDLLDELEDWSQPKALPVEEIWSLDAVNQGDSGLLNEAVLGPAFDWSDHGRDIINFIASYLDSPTQQADTSTFLPVLSTDARLLALSDTPSSVQPSSPAARVWRDRIIVGIGHSLGGGGMAYAASAAPSLFSSLILCDPVLPPPQLERSVIGLSTGAIVRREQWTTKSEAKEGFLKKAFFRQWDPRVLERYCEEGLKEVKGGVALKTRAIDEARTFCDPLALAARRAHARLELIPSALPIHFIMAEEGRSVLPEDWIDLLYARVPHATHARVKGAGHLVAQEMPRETAREIARALRRIYPLPESAKL